MPYPDHIGPDPELSRREHLRRIRARLTRFVLGLTERHRLPRVEARDFTLSHTNSDQYLRVHHEYYNTPRVFVPGSLLPRAFGDVTVVVTPSEAKHGEFDFHVAAAYPLEQEGERLLRDCVMLRQVYDAKKGTKELVLADETKAAEDFFEEMMELPAGSETFLLERTTLTEIMENIQPEDIVRPDDGVYVASLQLHLQELLDAIGYTGPES